jgi:predicted transposase YbfD/YdcC
LPKKTFEAAENADVHLIAQVKDNQPTLHQAVASLCDSTEPQAKASTTDANQRLRHETRTYEIFLPGAALAGSEWDDHVAAVIRVERLTNKRSAATGLWQGSAETAYYVCDIVPSIKQAAVAVRAHWGIENRLHYVRDCGFREDDSRIRSKPTVFARLRSFAANILRANNVQNFSDGRYRIAIAGLAGLRSLVLM